MEGSEYTRPQNHPAEEPISRPSLAERLMNPQPVHASASPPREPASRAADPPPSGDSVSRTPAPEPPATPPPARPTLGQRTAFNAMRSRSSLPGSDALRDARRFVRVRYFSFLASMAVLLLTFVIAAVVVGVSRLQDGAWEVQAGAGAVAALALLLLIFLQYNPAAGFAAAAAELAQLEALGSHLERSYALWDAFLEDRESKQQIVANEVALAVSSMTSATRELVAAQADFVTARRRPRVNEAQSQPRLPTPVSPDPRRY